MITLVSTRFRISAPEAVIYTQESHKSPSLRGDYGGESNRRPNSARPNHERITSNASLQFEKKVLEQGISESVRMGLLEIGASENDIPIIRYFKKLPTLVFSETEINENSMVNTPFVF